MLLVTLWAAPPILLFGYIWKAVIAQLIAPGFYPRIFECKELDRAVQLFDKVSHRLDELRQNDNRIIRSWRSLRGSPTEASDQSTDEVDELEAQKKYLLSTITTLRCQPLERLSFWVRVKSAQYALGRALVTYVVTFGITLVGVFQIFVTNSDFISDTGLLEWHLLDEANAIAVSFAVLLAPLFYLIRRIALRRQHGVEFCIAQQLASAAHWTPHALQAEIDVNQLLQSRSDANSNHGNWFKVLGLKKSASIDEVKKAYKALIRQNHPDRVQDMSPAFKELAETETKKLNIAYRQALSRTQQ